MTINVWTDYFGPINEFILPIQKILSQTRSLEDCLKFFTWYYENSKNYPEDLRLKNFEYQNIKKVLSAQSVNRSFSSHYEESIFPTCAYSFMTLRVKSMLKDCSEWLKTI